jgi:hypothetical protein
LVARSHPIHYSVERAERDRISLGRAYFSTDPYTYPSSWNPALSLSHRPNTFADMLNTFAAAGLWIEQTTEP